MTKEEEAALVAAADFLVREGGAPDSLWVPEFGWVMLDGKATETTKAFIEWWEKNPYGLASQVESKD